MDTMDTMDSMDYMDAMDDSMVFQGLLACGSYEPGRRLHASQARRPPCPPENRPASFALQAKNSMLFACR